MAKSSKQKVTATHPKSKREMKIDTAIYEPFNAAILQSLKGSKGKTFTELTDSVTKIIKKKIPLFDKSIPWYTISIKLDLETRGRIESFIKEGKKLIRIKL